MFENELIQRLAATWDHAKFCRFWDEKEWQKFINACRDNTLDIDAECVRLYELHGDY